MNIMKLSAMLNTVTMACLALTAARTHAQEYDGRCDTPEDVEMLPPRHWCEVPNSPLRAVEKRPRDYDDWDGKQSAKFDSYQRIMGIHGVTRAWGGAAFDTRRNCLLVTGGGHGDYGGNEIYRFCLSQLEWSRVSDPTPFPNRSPAIVNGDGTPISRHTYGGLAYIAAEDRLFMFDGAPDGPGGCGTRGTWTFNLTAREQSGSYSPTQWEQRSSEGEPRPGCDNVAVYDDITDRVFFKTLYGTHTYSYAEDRWQRVADAARLNSSVSLAIDAQRRRILETGGGATAVWNIGRRFDGGPVTTSGPREIESADNPGLAYDPIAERFVGWHGGTTVYAFDVDSRMWTAVPSAETNLFDPGDVTTSGGVFGRFAYSPASNVFVYVDRVTDNVVLYRHAAGEGIIAPKPPTSVSAAEE